MDYLCDYANLSPELFDYVIATPGIEQIYQVALGMKTLVQQASVDKFILGFDEWVFKTLTVRSQLLIFYK